MTTVEFVLLLFMNGTELKEYTLRDGMSECLKGKRIASRNISNSVEYQCIKSLAEIETDKLGNKHINKLILE